MVGIHSALNFFEHILRQLCLTVSFQVLRGQDFDQSRQDQVVGEYQLFRLCGVSVVPTDSSDCPLIVGVGYSSQAQCGLNITVMGSKEWKD
mgnify:CR=1 FL=1